MKTSSMREQILHGPVLPTMFRLAWPVMVGNALQALYNMIDAFWLGRLSTEALAAPGVAWPILFFFMSFGTGFQAAGSTLVAQHVGARNRDGAEEAGTQVISFLALTSVVLGAAGFFLGPVILRLIGTPAEVLPLALLYLRIECVGLPIMFAAFALGGLLLGVGDTRTMMYITAGTVALNAAFTPFLVFGWGPFPALGVAGAAVATVASRLVAACFGLWLLTPGRVGLRLRREYARLRWGTMRQILKVGTPNALDQAGTSLGFVILMGLVAGFGTTVVAAYGVGIRLINLLNVAIWGAASALVAMIGQNLGADQTERAEEISRRGIQATFLVLTALSGVAFLIRVPLFRTFISDPAVVAEGAWFMALFGFSVPFFGLFAAASAVFRGSGHTVPPMVFSLIRLWALRIVLSWILAYPAGLGTTGLWLGMSLSNVLGGSALYLWMRRGTWKTKVIRVPVTARGLAP
ncbi:TPA: MATE family efflux transporter [Candidatus Acetothermia bacterium]|nr:MATE family efflux transporter [Candidatus Acetothermia bacterium]